MSESEMREWIKKDLESMPRCDKCGFRGKVKNSESFNLCIACAPHLFSEEERARHQQLMAEIADDTASFAPGEYIADEIAARGWTVSQAARHLSHCETCLQAVIDGKTPVTQHLADKLAAMFGTSREVWMNLEETFRKDRP